MAETTTTTTTTAAPRSQGKAAQASSDDTFETSFSLFVPKSIQDQVESVEVEFVHDGKGKFQVPSIDGFTGAKVSERVQVAAPPHAIVIVRAKQPEPDADTGVQSLTRTLDAYGVAPTYTVNGISGLALGERNSIPLLGTLPAGDAPKAVAEGVVATG
jgi:hypothetical protein